MDNTSLSEDFDWWVPHTIARGQRRSERHLTFKSGWIVAANDRVITCAILNVSEHGACILIPAGARTEDRFSLFIDGSDQANQCTVAWRDGSRIGVRYD